MINKSLEVLKKLDFYIKMEPVGNLKYRITYPAITMYDKKYESFTKDYSIEEGGVILDGEFIELPGYLKRLSIFCDIISQIYYLGMNSNLLCFVKEDKQINDIFELIDIELDQDSKLKEDILYKMLLSQDVPEDDKKKVFKSFKLMKGLIL